MNPSTTMTTLSTTEALRMIEQSAAQRREDARIRTEQHELAAQQKAAQKEQDLAPLMSILRAAADKWPEQVAAHGASNTSGCFLSPYSARLFGREHVRSHSDRTLDIILKDDKSVLIKKQGRSSTEEVHAHSVAEMVPKLMDLLTEHLG